MRLRRRRPALRLTAFSWVDERAASRIPEVASRYPGALPLQVVAGARTATLGPAWRVSGSADCRRALAAFGVVEDVTVRR